MSNEKMIDLTDAEINENYSNPPFSPFDWNEVYLANLQKGTTKNGNTKHTLTLREVKTEEAIFHNINYDAKGQMQFASQHNKILNAFVQGKEKTVAEALRKAKGNKTITVWVKCTMSDTGHINIESVKKQMTDEDKMNDGLKKAQATGPATDDDDLPM